MRRGPRAARAIDFASNANEAGLGRGREKINNRRGEGASRAAQNGLIFVLLIECNILIFIEIMVPERGI
jgi:hypothetical protein